jgi:hypothetical protein
MTKTGMRVYINPFEVGGSLEKKHVGEYVSC